MYFFRQEGGGVEQCFFGEGVSLALFIRWGGGTFWQDGGVTKSVGKRSIVRLGAYRK